MPSPANPAGSSTPAGDTMNVPRNVSGGRTRNVVNVVNPGSTGTAAYTFTAATSSPSLATDGYANFRGQRYLHVQISGSLMHANDAGSITLWGYNEFSGKWGVLQKKDPTDASGYVDVQLSASVDNPHRYYIFDVKGMGRVAAECTSLAGPDADTFMTVYMGVNSF